MAANFNNCAIFMIFIMVYFFFFFWILVKRKLHFTNLAYPRNPNLNLDCTDYVCTPSNKTVECTSQIGNNLHQGERPRGTK